MRLSARSAGAFLSSYSVSAALVLFLKYLLYDEIPGYSSIVVLLVTLAIGLPLLFTEKSAFGVVSSSGFFGELAGSVFVTDEIKYGEPIVNSGVLFFIGLLLGFPTFFYPTWVVPLLISLFIYISLVFSYPEIALVLAILLVPFSGLIEAPSITTGACVLLLLLGYLFKLLLGKRSRLNNEVDIFYIIFLIGELGSAVSFSSASVKPAILTSVMVLGFILAVLLINRDVVLQRVVTVIVVSASLIAFIGSFQYVAGNAPLDWIDTGFFTEITARTVSLFDNPNMLGAYLSLVFPFALSLIFSTKGFKFRMLGVISSFLIVSCAILTWSRSSWIGLAIGFVTFALIYSPRSLIYIPLGAMLTGTAGFVFKETFGKRLLSFFSLSDHANSYRVSVWNGSFKTFIGCLFTGTGAGDTAFRNMYLNFCIPGTENAVHSHSIYLQIGISCGVLTLIAFIAWFGSVMRKSLRTVIYSPACEDRTILAAAVASLTSMAAIGIVDNVFYNYRILFMFFFVAGLCRSASNMLNHKLFSSKESFRHSGQVSVFME